MMKKRSIIIGWTCSYVIILLIPIIAIFANYIWNKKVIQNEIFQADKLVLTNIGNEIDRYLYKEIAFCSYIQQDKTFLKLAGSMKKDGQFYYDAAEVNRQMRNYDAEISCLAYLKEMDYVINNVVSNDSLFFYNGMKLAFPGMTAYEDWLELLDGEYRKEFFFGQYLHHKTAELCLIYADSIGAYSQYEPFNLFVSIPVSTMEELTKSLSDGSKLLIGIDKETALVLSSQGVEEITEDLRFSWDMENPAETKAYMAIFNASQLHGVEYCLIIPKDEFWRELRQVRNVLFASVVLTLVVGLFCVSVILNRNFKPVAKLVRRVAGDGKRRENEYKLIEDAYLRLMGEKDVMYRHIITQTEYMQGSYLLAMMKGRAVETVENAELLKPGQRMALAGFSVPLIDEKQILQDEVMLFAVDNIFCELMDGDGFYRIEDGQYLFYLFLVQGDEKEWKGRCMDAARQLCAIMAERLEVSVYSAVSGISCGPEKLRFLYQDVMEGLERARLRREPGVVDTESRNEAGTKGIIQSVTEYVEEHFEDSNLNISTIAEGIGRNPKYISRVFKEETGEGILDYVNRLRIRKAQALMRSGKYTLEQVSEMVGYASVKTFRRAFQKETGMTPGNYLDS